MLVLNLQFSMRDRRIAMSADDLTPIRILMANLSEPLRHSIVEMAHKGFQLRSVGQAIENTEALFAARTDRDLVILSAPDFKPILEIISHLLSASPHLKIPVLSTSQDRGQGWLSVQRCPIDYSTADMLRNSIQALSRMMPVYE